MTCVRWYLRFCEVPVLFPISARMRKCVACSGRVQSLRKRAGRTRLVYFGCRVPIELLTPPQTLQMEPKWYDPVC